MAKARKARSSANSIAQAAKGLLAVNPSTNAKTKSKKKRKDVGVGDIVMVKGQMTHWLGKMFKVTHVLDKDRVVAKTFMPQDEDFTGMETVLLTYVPQGMTKGGSFKTDYQTHITKVMLRAGAQSAQPKKVKPPKPVKVIDSHEGLVAHLASQDDTKVVLAIQNGGIPQTPFVDTETGDTWSPVLKIPEGARGLCKNNHICEYILAPGIDYFWSHVDPDERCGSVWPAANNNTDPTSVFNAIPRCPDFPAPCNCEDPAAGHHGHKGMESA